MRLKQMLTTVAALFVCGSLMTASAVAKTAQQINAEVASALNALYVKDAAAKELASQAKGILVFPSVAKAGLIIGGAHGVGALRVGGETEGYYQTSTGSIGLQAGIEERSEVIMFMTDAALNKFKASDNWEAGVDGSITVIDAGASGEVNTKNTQTPIVAYIFGNSGLYGGLNLEGAKISPYKPE